MDNTLTNTQPNVILIGAGIMSATLGTLLKELAPTTEVVHAADGSLALE